MTKFEGIWRAKWTADGSKTLEEISQRLRREADHIDSMAAAGISLAVPVDDDYAFLETEDPAVADKFCLSELETDE